MAHERRVKKSFILRRQAGHDDNEVAAAKPDPLRAAVDVLVNGPEGQGSIAPSTDTSGGAKTVKPEGTMATLELLMLP